MAGCGTTTIQDDEQPIQCCFDVKTSPTQIGWSQVCQFGSVCPGGETNEEDLCDQYCPPNYPEEMSGWWAPFNSAGTYLVWDCRTNTSETKPAPGAGDDDGGGETGGECDTNNAPLDPDDLHFQDRVHFSLSSTAGDITLTVGALTESPDYTLEGVFYIDQCAMRSGVEYCDLTLTSFVLETDSSMSFGATTITDAKVRLSESATTEVNMSTGAFSFPAATPLTMGVTWEESASTDENSKNLSNGSTLTGTLNIGGTTPTISFDGLFSQTGGSLDVDNVVADIINEMPDADASDTSQTVTCIPSTEDPAKTWVDLDGTESTDPDSNLEAWVWYAEDEIVGENEITEVLLAPGNYDVVLLVYDDLGSWSSTGFTLQVLSGTCS